MKLSRHCLNLSFKISVLGSSGWTETCLVAGVLHIDRSPWSLSSLGSESLWVAITHGEKEFMHSLRENLIDTQLYSHPGLLRIFSSSLYSSLSSGKPWSQIKQPRDKCVLGNGIKVIGQYSGSTDYKTDCFSGFFFFDNLASLETLEKAAEMWCWLFSDLQ